MQSAPPRFETNSAIREPGLAAALSVVPGVGQIYNGETRKGFLFFITGTINFFILLFWLFREPILTTSATIARALHMRLNDQLVASVLEIGPRSPQSFIILMVLISFIVFAMQDAFKQARLIRRNGIYPSSVLAISEAATGSYIMHFVLLAVAFLLVFLFLVPPPPHPQVTDIQFVDDQTETKKITKSDVHAQKSAEASGHHEPDKKISSAAPGQRSEQSHKAQRAQQQQQPHVPTHSLPTPTNNQPNQIHLPHPPAPHPPALSVPNLPSLMPPPVLPKTTSAQPRPPVPSRTATNSATTPLPPQPVLTPANTSQKLALLPTPSQTESRALAVPAPSRSGHRPGPPAVQSPSAPGPIADSSLHNDNSRPEPEPASGGHTTHVPNSNGAPQPSAIGRNTDPGANDLQQLRPALGNQGTGKDHSTNTTKTGDDHKIDKTGDIDFTGYMLDLQKRIKRAWLPPPNTASRRVVVQFKIHTDGELSNLRVEQSSGMALYDNAALKAVENAAPFRRLPPGADENVDIQFTFDYNVFQGSGGGASFSRRF